MLNTESIIFQVLHNDTSNGLKQRKIFFMSIDMKMYTTTKKASKTHLKQWKNFWVCFDIIKQWQKQQLWLQTVPTKIQWSSLMTGPRLFPTQTTMQECVFFDNEPLLLNKHDWKSQGCVWC